MSQRGAAFVLGLLLVVAPAVAADEYTFKPFVVATYSMPMDSTEARIGNQVAEIDLSDEMGWEVGIEWRFGKFLGLEAAYGSSDHEITFGGQRLGDATYEPIYLSLNFYAFPNESFDFWVAPTVVFTNWQEDDLQLGVGEGDDSETGFGLTVGFEWPLGETWALTSGLRYVDAQIGLGPNGEVAVDPLVLRFGIAARL